MVDDKLQNKSVIDAELGYVPSYIYIVNSVLGVYVASHLCLGFSLDRDSFPFDQQFNILMRFIVDQTQTPNLKVSIKPFQ